MRTIRHALVVAAALGCLAALPASAGAYFAGTGSDPAGDSTDPNRGRDIVGFSLGYDRRGGDLLGAIELASAPTGETPAFITLAAGTRVADGACEGYPAIGFGADTTSFDAAWLRMAGSGSTVASGDALKIGYLDRNMTFEIKARALRGLRPNCLVVILSEPGNSANVYDIAGPVALRGQPELGLRVRGAKSKIKPGQSRKYRVTIFNRGDSPTGRVRVKVGNITRFKIRPRRRVLGSVRPGARRTFAIRLTPAARASI